MIIKPQHPAAEKKIRNHSFPNLDLNRLHLETAEVRDPQVQLSLYQAQIESLNQQLTAIAKRRFEEGFAEGRRAGFEEGASAVQEYVDQLSEMLEVLRRQQEDVMNSAEDFIVAFALRVAEKIVGSEALANAPIDKGQLQKFTSDALSQFSDASKFVLRVHKSMVEFLKGNLAEIQQKMARPVSLAIAADPSLQPGDCLVECDHGVLDARIESRLKEIKSVFINNK
jgi:flagellar biosynthesis/type III secretory pathway protein FliH